MKKRPFRQLLFFVFCCAPVLACIILYVHRVDNTVNEEDEVFLTQVLNDNGAYPKTFKSFEEEVLYIQQVQTAVIGFATGTDSIPYGQSREPKDFVHAKTGWCYDKSRVIEKALRRAGFTTRHIGLYETNSGIPGKDLLTPGVRSHSLSEVKTSRGWMVVDSLEPWLSLNHQRQPISISGVQQSAENKDIQWDPELEPLMNNIFKAPFTFVYGLYSRHGKFYPPYNPIPDVNYGELMANF